MIPPDLALALLMNRTGAAYQASAPAYVTYREHTHVAGANKSEDIDRSVAVRVADDFAVMHDLPAGATRTGSAFPILPVFDPFSSFEFSYFANLKRIDINFKPGKPFNVGIPGPDPGVDVVVPYFSEYAPRYAPDSTDAAVHLIIDPTSRTGNAFYPSEVTEDPATHLPSHVSMQANGNDMVIGLDYKVIDGVWVITHGTFTSTQHAVMLTFKVSADVTYEDIAFSSTPPDPQLAGSPSPLPSATSQPR